MFKFVTVHFRVRFAAFKLRLAILLFGTAKENSARVLAGLRAFEDIDERPWFSFAVALSLTINK